MQRTLSNSIPFSAPSRLKMQLERKQKNRTYRIYPCKQCGVDMALNCTNAATRSYCSNSCVTIARQKTIEKFSCAICKTPVERRRRNLLRNQSNRVCSLQCQNKLRNKLSHQRRHEKINWQKRSEVARKRLRLKRQRKWQSEMRPFCYAVDRLLQKVENRLKKPTWLTKIHQRLVKRPKPVKKHRHTRPPGVAGAITRFESRVSYFRIDPWLKKIGNKLSNSKKRLRLKREIKRIEFSNCSQKEVRAKPTQMCFDWMATDC